MKPRSQKRCYGCDVPIIRVNSRVVSFRDTSIDICEDCDRDAYDSGVQWYHEASRVLTVPAIQKRRAINRLKGG